LESARLNGADPLWPFHLSFYLLTAVAVAAVVLAISMPRPPATFTATPN